MEPSSSRPADTTIAYFPSLTLDASETLTEAEAHAEGTFVRAYLVHGAPVQAEIVVQGRISEVVYYQAGEPAAALLATHQAAYGDTPVRIIKPPVRAERGVMVEACHYTSRGEKLTSIQAGLDDAGHVLWELLCGPAGERRGEIRYSYDAQHNLVRRQEFDADGQLVADERFAEDA